MSLTSSTAFFLFLISLSTFPSTPKSSDATPVQVKYSRHPIRRTEGQPLTLQCTAEYNEEYCGNISLFWCLLVSEPPCQPLTDPDKYLVRVNATILTGKTGSRQQDIIVTFTQLTLNDTGLYQCEAVCQHSGATAMGHLISVTVTGQKATTNLFSTVDANKTQRIRDRSGRCTVDMYLLAISVFLLSWIHKM